MVRSLTRAEPVELQGGADKTLNIALYDAAGDPLVVTGKTAEFKMYDAVARRARKPWTGNPVLEKTSAAGEIVLSSGNAAVSIQDTDLDGKSGDFWYIVLVTTTADGSVAHGAEGEVFLRRRPE